MENEEFNRAVEGQVGRNMPNPTPDEIKHPAFLTVWEAVKGWDIGAPEWYSGYCEANGSHVKIILDALWHAAYPQQPQFTAGITVTEPGGSDGRDWYKLPWGWWRWQRFVDAWLCLIGKHSLHKAWQNGYDRGSMREYYRTVIMGGR